MIPTNLIDAKEEILRLRAALKKIAEGYSGEDGAPYVLLADLGAELRRRQDIAKQALENKVWR